MCVQAIKLQTGLDESFGLVPNREQCRIFSGAISLGSKVWIIQPADHSSRLIHPRGKQPRFPNHDHGIAVRAAASGWLHPVYQSIPWFRWRLSFFTTQRSYFFWADIIFCEPAFTKLDFVFRGIVTITPTVTLVNKTSSTSGSSPSSGYFLWNTSKYLS